MAVPQATPPAVQLVALFSRHPSALDWGVRKVAEGWGQIELTSARFDHRETEYYTRQMGSELIKQFVLLAGLYDPAGLSKSKLQSNAWEQELAETGEYPEERPLNIDPGYVTLNKLVLASCKDRAHRIYLSDGIYAEECLYYLDRKWQSRPWTYPDYQREDFQSFFVQARQALKRLL